MLSQRPVARREVRLFELDNGTMSQARLAKEVWDYERYAGHRVWEGPAAPTAARSRLAAPPLHPLPDLPAAACRPGEQGGAPARQPPPGARRRREGDRVAVWVNTLPRLQRGEPWYEIGVDDPDRHRRRCSVWIATSTPDQKA
ncbi:replication-relaxation family protein [Streptomyces pseudogriseolus]|uniref:replication-relaxation family protein n=1 Tax=Streptomyces pseudogriseolus TaxID=36817 RepID=UPI001CE36036|nr:replication-relaxation family protein [Streptomyces pseudogriseolus]